MTTPGPEVRTDRLLLRRWRPTDLEPFAALNADPEVMEYFPHTRTRAETKELIGVFEDQFERQGFGLWALEVSEHARFVGMVGLAVIAQGWVLESSVELGWRLARTEWGHGYATEAARAAVRFAFDELDLGEVVAMTSVDNLRSRRVMDRLGMVHDPSLDFDHPRFPAGHPHQRHVMYRLKR